MHVRVEDMKPLDYFFFMPHTTLVCLLLSMCSRVRAG